MRGDWNYPTSVRFGPGRIAELPQACAELGIARPLIVTDRGLVQAGLACAPVEACARAGMATGVFWDLRPNPVGRDVDAGVEAYRRGGFDGVVAFGGGSALDVAKAVALMVGQDRPLWDFEDVGDNWTRVDTRNIAPVVAVPTTSGTGSEVGRASVITDERDHRKVIIFHPRMLPGRVLCDPELTVGLPPFLTAAVGMDALSHNLEAYCAPGFHPLADGVAMEGIRIVFEALPVAVADGADVGARAKMMAASLMGATAFQKGLGGMHALSHPVGAVLDAHHGLTNAIVMATVLRYNEPAIAGRLARLARLLDLPSSTSTAFIDAIEALRDRIGLPDHLGAVGMTADHVEHLAPMAARDPSAAGNPRPLTAATCAALYRNALGSS